MYSIPFDCCKFGKQNVYCTNTNRGKSTSEEDERVEREKKRGSEELKGESVGGDEENEQRCRECASVKEKVEREESSEEEEEEGRKGGLDFLFLVSRDRNEFFRFRKSIH